MIQKGEYIRVWIPELVNIQKGKIHAPWTLRQGDLGTVKLGVDYPTPMVIAPEWSRHLDKSVRLVAQQYFSIELFHFVSNFTEIRSLGRSIKNETEGSRLLL